MTYGRDPLTSTVSEGASSVTAIYERPANHLAAIMSDVPVPR